MVLYIIMGLLVLTLFYNWVISVLITRNLKELLIYKKSKYKNIIEQKAQEELINNWSD